MFCYPSLRNLTISSQLCSFIYITETGRCARFQVEIKGPCPNQNSRDGIIGHQFNKRISSPLLNAILSSFYWWIFKKTILFSGFKIPDKKIRETRKLESIHE